MPREEAASGRLEAGQVQAMFDRIAGVYDVMNTAMTAGLHHRWRRRAADMARLGAGMQALDVATGTGDLALELASRVGPDGDVLGCDFAEAMLDRARLKVASPGSAQPRFEWGDAMQLPYPDATFDAATVGFGARNFDDLGRGLSEMARVVRPGGRVVVLEITTPVRPPLSWFYRFWFDRAVPQLGRLAAAAGQGADGRLADAYTYLPSSVRRFPGPVDLAGELHAAGLTEIAWILTAGGIIAIHHGTVAGRR